MTGFLGALVIWAITEIARAIRGNVKQRRLAVAHVPEIDRATAAAWKGLAESTQAQLDAMTKASAERQRRYDILAARVEKLEINKSTMDRLFDLQREENALLEEIIGAFYPLLVKADTKTREFIEHKRERLKIVRADAHDWRIRREEYMQFLVGDLPTLSVAGEVREYDAVHAPPQAEPVESGN